MPVDYTAKSIIGLSQIEYTKPNGWHLSNPDQRSFGEFFKMINNLGYPMDIIDVETWYKKLETIPKDNALHPLIPFHNHGHTAPFVKVETKNKLKPKTEYVLVKENQKVSKITADVFKCRKST